MILFWGVCDRAKVLLLCSARVREATIGRGSLSRGMLVAQGEPKLAVWNACR